MRDCLFGTNVEFLHYLPPRTLTLVIAGAVSPFLMRRPHQGHFPETRFLWVDGHNELNTSIVLWGSQ